MKEKLSELVEWLNARTLEYNTGNPTVSDFEWDDKYFKLVSLELALGYSLENSPTQRIIAEVDNLTKVKHNHKMLSLEKTKDIEVIKDFVGNKPFLAMCKMDGLTCSLHYKNGQLIGAETRGDGIIGEDIYHNALRIPTIPNNILYQDELIVDGEIICTYENFKEFSKDYANVRNYASGSIRLLNSNECANRKLTFVAWEVIKGLDNVCEDYLNFKLDYLKTLNFVTVPYFINKEISIDNIIEKLINIAKEYSYPIDGIVFKFNDIKYGKTLGETAHHFRNAKAFKFEDETYTTSLKNIEWTLGRTGVLTPIAVFDPVDDGESIIERASMHNVSVMHNLLGKKPYNGQTLEVFKANMIIPQIKSAGIPESVADIDSLEFVIPDKCPVCGGSAEFEENNDVINLICTNPTCEGKFINKLEHFCSKKGLDIKGLSKATLEKLVDWDWITKISDLFILFEHRAEWIKKPGFGPKSVDNILESIEAAKTNTDIAFIAALGIPLIGNTVAKELMKHFNGYLDLRQAIINDYDFTLLDGFAEAKCLVLHNFDFTEADYIYNNYITAINNDNSNNTQSSCKDLKFVITGKLNKFKTRNDLKTLIEDMGGKVIDSVSKNTNYLINNDITSTSSKNNSAKKLGIPIISEEEFFEKFFKNS